MTDSTLALPDPLAQSGVGIAHHLAAGVYAKETRIPAGVELIQHSHAHSHLSILAAGSALVDCDGEIKSYTAPACIEIKAGVSHRVEAITDVLWFCVHPTHETNPARVDASILLGGGPHG